MVFHQERSPIMPKVTVLMPTFNVAPWVEEAIRSVLVQTYQDFELLVMDDCSTDNTLEVVRSIHSSKIRIEMNEHNLGLSANLNRGLSLIDTEYVARMDGDDIAEPTWLEKEVAILEAHPEIGICGAGWEWFSSKSGTGRYPELPEDNKANLLFGCSVIVPTFRMSLYRDLGLRYREDAFPAEDYRFWVDCVRHTQIYNIQETLFHYRMHPSQICTSKRMAQLEKVAETRRTMLLWLAPDLAENEVQYFLNSFAQGVISSKQELRQARLFSKKLLHCNAKEGNCSSVALKNRIHSLIVLAVYDYVVRTYFSQGYSLRKYANYLFSGMAFHTNRKYEIKFFAKSVLHKHA